MGWAEKLRILGPSGKPARRLPTVALGYCFGTIHSEFIHSVIKLREREIAKMKEDGSRRERPHVYVRHYMPQPGLYIDHNRNMLVQKFLGTEADWLLQIDTDVEFPPDLPEKMLALCGDSRKILAVSVPLGPPLPSCGWMMTEKPGVWQSVQTTHWCPKCSKDNEVYSLTSTPGGLLCSRCGAGYKVDEEPIAGQLILPNDRPLEVDGIATAVCIIHRTVFEDIADRVGQMWFFKTLQPLLSEETSRAAWPEQVGGAGTGPMRDRRYVNVGEDLAFSMRAHDAGHKIYVAKLPGLRHYKRLPLSHDIEGESVHAEVRG